LRLIAKSFLTYGAVILRGKAAVLVFIAVPAWAEPVTVLAFGDSLTQGYGLAAEDGFVPQLERWLEGRGAEAELVNGGVSGDTTAGAAARIGWSLTPEIDAMIVILGGNDALRGLDPQDMRRNLTEILDTARKREVPVLLVGMPAPGNFGEEYKTAFEAVYSDLAKAYDVSLFDSFFQGLGEGGFAEQRAYFQPEGIHPNAEGIARIVADLGPEVLRLIGKTK